MISISEENKTLRKMEIGPLKPNHTKLVKAFVENLESSEVYQLSKASPLISDYISLRSNEIRHFRDLLSMVSEFKSFLLFPQSDLLPKAWNNDATG